MLGEEKLEKNTKDKICRLKSTLKSFTSPYRCLKPVCNNSDVPMTRCSVRKFVPSWTAGTIILES